MIEEKDREPRRGTVSGLGEGLRSGIGILTAFKDAIEETIQEATERGDLSPERAGQALRDTVRRVQGGMDEARERLDLVPRKELQALQAQVAELRRRLEVLERRDHPAADGGIIIEAE